MKELPFRQIHLDFHTSGDIPDIGKDYTKESFQKSLKYGHVNSITLFAKCHHGWMYYFSKKYEIHPNLSFDLLKQMITDAHEIGIRVVVYISAGYDEKLALKHPEWLIRNKDESLDTTKNFMDPGYHQFCMNSDYLQVLKGQTEEILELFTMEGLFLDIVGERECYCHNCLNEAYQKGIEPEDKEAMATIWQQTYKKYIEVVHNAVSKSQPNIEIFHNSGHIDRSRQDLLEVSTHWELESLPTGGWGYDHFVTSARFVQSLGKMYTGMTGRFHYGWGDFGGYKHPNGLLFETSRFLAHGARCSIGDQMHPFGKLDEGAYQMIGKAYEEVEKKEPWCHGVNSVTDIGIISNESLGTYKISGAKDSLANGLSDTGAIRILTEGHFLYDMIGPFSDFSKYKVLILPDIVIGNKELELKLLSFIHNGGTLLATGLSGIGAKTGSFEGMLLPLGAVWKGEDTNCPNYVVPEFTLNELNAESFVMYLGSQNFSLTNEQSQKFEYNNSNQVQVLAWKEFTFFNRTVSHFCSHLHTPGTKKATTPGIIRNSTGIYSSWKLFEEYAEKGNFIAKYIAIKLLNMLLDGKKTIECELPAQAQVTLMDQVSENRYVLHMLYGSPISRGKGIEVIEDLLQLPETHIKVRTKYHINNVYLAPQMISLEFRELNGTILYTIPPWSCHQIVVMDYEK